MISRSEFAHVPLVDVGALVNRSADRLRVATEIGRACRECGFFYVVNHGVSEDLCQELEQLSREFFAQPEAKKMEISMAHGGRAWRGYFPVGQELTSGKPDRKEGLYFGAELSREHPAVIARRPLHGPNLFPDLPGFRETVLRYLAALTELGHALMSGINLDLGLPEDHFRKHYTNDPLILFRIFNYPAEFSQACDDSWGVGEHTDYGLLTILRQDDTGGLQVKSRSQWIAAPPIPGSFLCNLGDMLQLLTRGIYRSTPHRVLNTSDRDRLSFPFFFDPNFDVMVQPIAELNADSAVDDSHDRWDQANLHAFSGTYEEYLLAKVSKVFPQLRNDVL
ncbi:MAG: 2-oxoglutarate and iron-dependent oxygenase domain-containing protein [Planctomycetaceae bacterium]